MSPRTGRPPSENPKAERITVRLSRHQMDQLEKCADTMETTKADIICMGLELMEIEMLYPESKDLFEEIINLHGILMCREVSSDDYIDNMVNETLERIKSSCMDFVRSMKK